MRERVREPGEEVVQITEQGALLLEDLYASLHRKEAEDLREKIGQALKEISAMSPEELFEEAFRIAASEETEQIDPES